ncbi:MAG: succinate dehydrogenase/fumarate reductase iron-sulfur subunit [Elainellaceae cyanobacterium]
MKVQFAIARHNPTQGSFSQTYVLEVEPGQTILDCLDRIKWEQDGTLAFRKNCRNTICGSCSMRINGRSTLACKENVGQELARLQRIAAAAPTMGTGSPTTSGDPLVNGGAASGAPSEIQPLPTITIAPMGNMPVIKDLVVNMQSFWDNLEAVEPYVSSQSRQIPEREFLQTPAERDRLNQTGNCILCGACYSECNAREVSSDFVGPHALAKAYRMVADSRDERTEPRLEQYSKGIQGVWGCTRCYYCNEVCPMGVAPMDQIGKIKQEILSRSDASASRPIRHRKAMVDLVKQGGWVDERKFGITVVGNYFRDLRGLASLGPLGLRMLLRGKFPLSFEPSEGTQEVRSLINAVKAADRSSVST